MRHLWKAAALTFTCAAALFVLEAPAAPTRRPSSRTPTSVRADHGLEVLAELAAGDGRGRCWIIGEPTFGMTSTARCGCDHRPGFIHSFL